MALVLIVDDSPTDVHVMQQALEQHGFRTAAASFFLLMSWMTPMISPWWSRMGTTSIDFVR